MLNFGKVEIEALREELEQLDNDVDAYVGCVAALHGRGGSFRDVLAPILIHLATGEPVSVAGWARGGHVRRVYGQVARRTRGGWVFVIHPWLRELLNPLAEDLRLRMASQTDAT